MTATREAFIGLGANLGCPRRMLRRALWTLGLPVLDCSSLYRSSPRETAIAQPDYLNAVARIGVRSFDAYGLLQHLLDVEARLGRVRGPGKPPRVIDLDLLLFADEQYHGERLTLPHPRLAQRRFVLQPLLEIAPDRRMPDGHPLRCALQGVCDQQVRRLEGRSWWWRMTSSCCGCSPGKASSRKNG